MITRRNQYKGFTTQESINADKVMDFLDKLSLKVEKKTVVVLDNAFVHRNRKIKELRNILEKEDCPFSIFLHILQNLIMPKHYGVYERKMD